MRSTTWNVNFLMYVQQVVAYLVKATQSGYSTLIVVIRKKKNRTAAQFHVHFTIRFDLDPVFGIASDLMLRERVLASQALQVMINSQCKNSYMLVGM